MRTILWFFWFWASLVRLVPDMRRAQRLYNSGDTAGCDAIVAKRVCSWADGRLNRAGVELRVSGLENIPQEPVVFVGNHQGNFDIPIVMTTLPRAGILAKQELTKLPLIRTWMKLMGCVFIDRKSPRQSVAALGEAIKQVEAGRSMIVFPEGTRSKGDDMGDFKAGAFKIALKTKVPIVPVCIDGSYKVMEQNGNWIRPATVTLKVLPAIATVGLDKESAKALPAQVRALIAANK